MRISETQICTEFNYTLHTLNLRVLDTEFKYALDEEVLLFVFPSYLLNSQKHATVNLWSIKLAESNCIL
jgi:hypothetical protein